MAAAALARPGVSVARGQPQRRPEHGPDPGPGGSAASVFGRAGSLPSPPGPGNLPAVAPQQQGPAAAAPAAIAATGSVAVILIVLS